MALTKRAEILIANLARRGDSFARNVLYKATPRDQVLMISLAKRGDLLAQRHVKGAAGITKRAAVEVKRMARQGDLIFQGIASVAADKQAQVITFAQPDPIELADAETPETVELVATSSKSLPVSFEVVSGPGTIDGDELTVTEAGDVVVRAVQKGNQNVAAATPVSRTITVTIAGG